jgi:hypothetical protein
MLTSYGGKNADVIWREKSRQMGAIKLLAYMGKAEINT